MLQLLAVVRDLLEHAAQRAGELGELSASDAFRSIGLGVAPVVDEEVVPTDRHVAEVPAMVVAETSVRVDLAVQRPAEHFERALGTARDHDVSHHRDDEDSDGREEQPVGDGCRQEDAHHPRQDEQLEAVPEHRRCQVRNLGLFEVLGAQFCRPVVTGSHQTSTMRTSHQDYYII